MKRTTAQKIADALIALFAVLIVCDVLLTCLSPALAYFRFQSPDRMAFSPSQGCMAWALTPGKVR